MRKGLIVALAVAGLFVSGSSFAALDLSQPSRIDWALWAQVIAAVATTFAALAAWRAASHSKSQSDTMVRSEARSLVESHRRGFLEDLDRFSENYPAKFYLPVPLYWLVFPRNKADGCDFSYVGDEEFLAQVQRDYVRLVGMTSRCSPDFDYSWWAGAINKLSIQICLDSYAPEGFFKEQSERYRQVVVESYEGLDPDWQLPFQGLPTGFTLVSTGSIMHSLYNAIRYLVGLAGITPIIDGEFPEDEFMLALMQHIASEQEKLSAAVAPQH